MKEAIAKAEAPYQLPKDGTIPENKFKSIFQYAVLSKRGYPSDLVHASTVGMNPNRFQAKIIKPLQPFSTKVIENTSVESRLYRFAQGFLDTQINPYSDVPYDVHDMNIILSDPLADYQERHIDYEDYSDPKTKAYSNFSVILPYEERASACVWEESHYAVEAGHKVHTGLVPPPIGFSQMSDILKEQGKEYLMEGMAMKEVFFGTNQMFLFLDNTVHSGAANHMNKKVYRLHFYVVRRNSEAPTKYTFFPSEIVWDLTRSGSLTPKLYLSELKKNMTLAHLLDKVISYDTSDEDSDTDTEKPSKASKKKTPVAHAAKPAAKPSSSKKDAKESPRKHTRAADNEENAKQRKRGRPRKFMVDD
jgi:hypothetical protein